MKNFLIKTDPKIFNLIQKEFKRQKEGINLIPSENYVSQAVLEAIGSVLTNKYSEGYPDKRYYSGHQFIDQIEKIAIARAKKLFQAEHANVQLHSGSQANQAIYLAFLKSGDKVLAMDLRAGGHITHGLSVNFSGQIYKFFHYGINKKTGLIDLDEVKKIAQKIKPKMIICGATSYPRIIDFKGFGEIAKSVGALLVSDVAHIAGLIIAKLHPHCFPFADAVTSTTHKTLRGPRAGLILCQKKYAQAIDRAVFPGIQGGPHQHIVAAKAVCFTEALKPGFIKYQKQVIKNAQILAQSLVEEDFNLVTGGTDNHLILADLTGFNITGQQAQEALEEVGIYVNKNVIPYDQRSPSDPSGIRIGSPALTSRGFKEKKMRIIGKLVAKVIKNIKSNKIKKETKKAVKELIIM